MKVRPKLVLIFFMFSNICLSSVVSYPLPNNMPAHTKFLWGKKGVLRLTGIAPENRIDELKLRTSMLQMHQKLALASWASFAYQSYLGNQMVNGNYENHSTHKKLSVPVWSLYMSSAALSYFAPPALKYSDKLDSMKLHRWLSFLHFSGMAIIPILGYKIHDATNYQKAVETHQNVALVTFFSMSLSALLTFLPY